MMTGTEKIHRLLQQAFLEIRHEARTQGDLRNIAALADLFHNVPLALIQEGADPDAVLAGLTQKASANAGLSQWLAVNSG